MIFWKQWRKRLSWLKPKKCYPFSVNLASGVQNCAVNKWPKAYWYPWIRTALLILLDISDLTSLFKGIEYKLAPGRTSHYEIWESYRKVEKSNNAFKADENCCVFLPLFWDLFQTVFQWKTEGYMFMSSYECLLILGAMLHVIPWGTEHLVDKLLQSNGRSIESH